MAGWFSYLDCSQAGCLHFVVQRSGRCLVLEAVRLCLLTGSFVECCATYPPAGNLLKLPLWVLTTRHLIEVRVGGVEVYRGKFLTVFQDSVELPDEP